MRGAIPPFPPPPWRGAKFSTGTTLPLPSPATGTRSVLHFFVFRNFCLIQRVSEFLLYYEEICLQRYL
jgi:hypothetical protein